MGYVLFLKDNTMFNTLMNFQTLLTPGQGGYKNLDPFRGRTHLQLHSLDWPMVR